jgi:hypothetical protein
MRPSDLRGAAADAYRMWTRTFGLSERAAMNLLAEDGLVPTSDDDRLAGRFTSMFGLPESGARIAAEGRDGGRAAASGSVSEGLSGSGRSVSEALSEMSDSDFSRLLEDERRRRQSETASGTVTELREHGKRR